MIARVDYELIGHGLSAKRLARRPGFRDLGRPYSSLACFAE